MSSETREHNCYGVAYIQSVYNYRMYTNDDKAGGAAPQVSFNPHCKWHFAPLLLISPRSQIGNDCRIASVDITMSNNRAIGVIFSIR